VGRVSLYLRQLEAAQKQGRETISSHNLAQALALTDAQVRKDLAFFGQFGYPGVGYRIPELIETLRRILGIDRAWPTALIGLGNLGRALINYRGFKSRGFHVVALFDNDEKKVGRTLGGLTVQAIGELRETVRERQIDLAILCVPADSAQGVADLAVACGIHGLLNFAPLPLTVPAGVTVMGVDLSVQLELLAYQVQNRPATAGNGEP
jgi:redox-sensing transcriptional repressor